jgi:hypothetical protein
VVASRAGTRTTLAVSKEREAQITKDTISSAVARGATKEQAGAELAAALAAWRAKVDKPDTVFEVGYRAIYTASILDDAKSLTDATAAVAQAIAIVAALKQPDKPAPPKEASP